MTDLSASRAARCPAAAGAILTALERRSVRSGAGQDVVSVRSVADAVHWIEPFRDGVLFADLVPVAVKLVGIHGDAAAFGVVPRSVADAIACVHGRLTLGRARAEIGAPRVIAGVLGGRQGLAMRVGPRKAP